MQAAQAGLHLDPTQVERLAVTGSLHPALRELRKENHQLKEALVDSRESEERLGAELQVNPASTCMSLGQDHLAVAPLRPMAAARMRSACRLSCLPLHAPGRTLWLGFHSAESGATCAPLQLSYAEFFSPPFSRL